MKYLLDTHIFIWWMEKNKRLPIDIKRLIDDSRNLAFISVASVWEIILKKRRKKLKVPRDIEGNIKKAGFSIIPIQISHVLLLEKLSFHHTDPFDRLLISQAKTEDLTLITHDRQIWKYDVDILKA